MASATTLLISMSCSLYHTTMLASVKSPLPTSTYTVQGKNELRRGFASGLLTCTVGRGWIRPLARQSDLTPQQAGIVRVPGSYRTVQATYL